jgi:hypothetical protein
MHGTIVSDVAPSEGDDVVHGLASGAQAAPDGRAEERMVVAASGTLRARLQRMVSTYMKLALSTRKSS